MKRLLLLFACAILSAAPTLTVAKTPFEAFNIGVDFTPVIGTDGLTLISTFATNIVNGQDVSSSIIAASPAPAIVPTTDKVVLRVQNGLDGQQILVGVRVSDTATGETFEGQLMLLVKAR